MVLVCVGKICSIIRTLEGKEDTNDDLKHIMVLCQFYYPNNNTNIRTNDKFI